MQACEVVWQNVQSLVPVIFGHTNVLMFGNVLTFANAVYEMEINEHETWYKNVTLHRISVTLMKLIDDTRTIRSHGKTIKTRFNTEQPCQDIS